jgi:predicted transcriptional regulator
MAHPAPNQNKPWTPSDVDELRAFVEEEMSATEIAHELGRTPKAVRAKAAEEEIPLTPPSDETADLDD